MWPEQGHSHLLSEDGRISKARHGNQHLQPAGAQPKPPVQACTVHQCLFSLPRGHDPLARWLAG